jgi:hypothetical protein
VVALVIGIAIGAGSKTTGISQATYSASQAHASSLKSQVSTLQGQVSTDNAAVTTARSTAATAQQTANTNAAAAYKSRQTALSATYQSKESALAATYQSKEATLAATQQTTNSQAATLKQELGEIQAHTINGDGTYIVGQDIKGGTYHTNGSGDTGQNDCYYATLSSTDGSLGSIIANGNFDGPETMDLSGVYAFQANGPCTWSLVP